MPRKTQYAQQDPGSPAGRIERLLREVWDGNQRAMAADIGMSQTLISKVVRGEQSPGRRMLEAIAAHPKINPGWIHTGQGEPLRALQRDVPGHDWLVPVSRCILPGPPAQHAGLLSGVHVPEANYYRRSTRYMLEVQAYDPIVAVHELKIAAGDLLLMETDRHVWRSNWRILLDEISAVRLTIEGGLVDYQLRRGCLALDGQAVSFPAMIENGGAREGRHGPDPRARLRSLEGISPETLAVANPGEARRRGFASEATWESPSVEGDEGTPPERATSSPAVAGKGTPTEPPSARGEAILTIDDVVGYRVTSRRDRV